ncbi:MAG: hypothetical protein JJ850_03460 [Kordiimonadaceae bacterium]|nr:hypothetical protein [Kordiimonadaceae bacterium]MBO6567137.1 hypothetical protein [Kordiimonadaceae bacterium]MBO6963648.1 hypothetical protein [Kordiimonadaceae bacterium]
MNSITYRATWLKTLALPTMLTLVLVGAFDSERNRIETLYVVLIFWLIAMIRLLYIVLHRGLDSYSVDQDGFTFSRWKGQIRWESIDKIMSYSTPINTYIYFSLKDGNQPQSNRPWPSGLFDRLGSAVDRGEVWVSTSSFNEKHATMLEATFDAFCAAIPGAVREEKECRAPSAH